MVCQAPKKMKTPYFMVHIIIKNTCTTPASQQRCFTVSHDREQMCSCLACTDLSTSAEHKALLALTWVTMAPEISCVNTVMD